MSESTPRLVGVSVECAIDLVGPITVGRSDESDLKLTQGHPSRRHARLEVSGDEVWLEDAGSTNGTFVNGTRIERRTRLNPGDEVAFDEERYRFEAGSAPMEQATIVRPSLDLDATVVSTPPLHPPAEADPAPTHSPEPEDSASGEEVASASSSRRPGSWPDSGLGEVGGTVIMEEGEELAHLRDQVEQGDEPGATQATDVPTLVVSSGERAGRHLVLHGSGDSDVWSVGSDPGRDVVLTDSGVSGFHAKIVREGSRWKVVDQMSANGTFVNGRRSSVSVLGDGSQLRFGPVNCVIRLPSAGGAAEAGIHLPGGGTKWIAIASFLVVLGGVLAAVFLLG